MTLKQFSRIIDAARYRPRCIRLGQALFNALRETDSGIADEIRGTKLDPFYHDARASAFTAHLVTNFVEWD
jgi:hypothetical protein